MYSKRLAPTHRVVIRVAMESDEAGQAPVPWAGSGNGAQRGGAETVHEKRISCLFAVVNTQFPGLYCTHSKHTVHTSSESTSTVINKVGTFKI